MPRSGGHGNPGIHRECTVGFLRARKGAYSPGSTFSVDVLVEVEQLAGRKLSHSAFFESVLRRYIRDKPRAYAQAKDLDRINSAADQLNSESADVLDYQAAAD
jgi:hypothetical protein